MRRETILDNLKNRLKTITTANGYGWEPKVFEWLTTPLGSGDFPAVVVKDTEDSVDSEKISGVSEHSLKIEILLFVKEGVLTSKALRAKMQDLLFVIGKEPEVGEDLGDYISFDGNEIALDQQRDIEGGAKIELTVIYSTSKWEI